MNSYTCFTSQTSSSQPPPSLPPPTQNKYRQTDIKRNSDYQPMPFYSDASKGEVASRMDANGHQHNSRFETSHSLHGQLQDAQPASFPSVHYHYLPTNSSLAIPTGGEAASRNEVSTMYTQSHHRMQHHHTFNDQSRQNHQILQEPVARPPPAQVSKPPEHHNPYKNLSKALPPTNQSQDITNSFNNVSTSADIHTKGAGSNSNSQQSMIAGHIVHQMKPPARSSQKIYNNPYLDRQQSNENLAGKNCSGDKGQATNSLNMSSRYVNSESNRYVNTMQTVQYEQTRRESGSREKEPRFRVDDGRQQPQQQQQQQLPQAPQSSSFSSIAVSQPPSSLPTFHFSNVNSSSYQGCKDSAKFGQDESHTIQSLTAVDAQKGTVQSQNLQSLYNKDAYYKSCIQSLNIGEGRQEQYSTEMAKFPALMSTTFEERNAQARLVGIGRESQRLLNRSFDLRAQEASQSSLQQLQQPTHTQIQVYQRKPNKDENERRPSYPLEAGRDDSHGKYSTSANNSLHREEGPNNQRYAAPQPVDLSRRHQPTSIVNPSHYQSVHQSFSYRSKFGRMHQDNGVKQMMHEMQQPSERFHCTSNSHSPMRNGQELQNKQDDQISQSMGNLQAQMQPISSVNRSTDHIYMSHLSHSRKEGQEYTKTAHQAHQYQPPPAQSTQKLAHSSDFSVSQYFGATKAALSKYRQAAAEYRENSEKVDGLEAFDQIVEKIQKIKSEQFGRSQENSSKVSSIRKREATHQVSKSLVTTDRANQQPLLQSSSITAVYNPLQTVVPRPSKSVQRTTPENSTIQLFDGRFKIMTKQEWKEAENASARDQEREAADIQDFKKMKNLRNDDIQGRNQPINPYKRRNTSSFTKGQQSSIRKTMQLQDVPDHGANSRQRYHHNTGDPAGNDSKWCTQQEQISEKLMQSSEPIKVDGLSRSNSYVVSHKASRQELNSNITKQLKQNDSKEQRKLTHEPFSFCPNTLCKQSLEPIEQSVSDGHQDYGRNGTRKTLGEAEQPTFDGRMKFHGKQQLQNWSNQMINQDSLTEMNDYLARSSAACNQNARSANVTALAEENEKSGASITKTVKPSSSSPRCQNCCQCYQMARQMQPMALYPLEIPSSTMTQLVTSYLSENEIPETSTCLPSSIVKGLLQHLNRNTLLKAKKKLKRYKAQVKEVEEQQVQRNNEINELRDQVEKLNRELVTQSSCMAEDQQERAQKDRELEELRELTEKLNQDRERALEDCKRCLEDAKRSREEMEQVRADAERELNEMKGKLHNKKEKYKRVKQELKNQIEEKYTIAGKLSQIELQYNQRYQNDDGNSKERSASYSRNAKNQVNISRNTNISEKKEVALMDCNARAVKSPSDRAGIHSVSQTRLKSEQVDLSSRFQTQRASKANQSKNSQESRNRKLNLDKKSLGRVASIQRVALKVQKSEKTISRSSHLTKENRTPSAQAVLKKQVSINKNLQNCQSQPQMSAPPQSHLINHKHILNEISGSEGQSHESRRRSFRGEQNLTENESGVEQHVSEVEVYEQQRSQRSFSERNMQQLTQHGQPKHRHQHSFNQPSARLEDYQAQRPCSQGYLDAYFNDQDRHELNKVSGISSNLEDKHNLVKFLQLPHDLQKKLLDLFGSQPHSIQHDENPDSRVDMAQMKKMERQYYSSNVSQRRIDQQQFTRRKTVKEQQTVSYGEQREQNQLIARRESELSQGFSSFINVSKPISQSDQYQPFMPLHYLNPRSTSPPKMEEQQTQSVKNLPQMVCNPNPIAVPMPASMAYKNALLTKLTQRTNSMAVDCLASGQWPEIVEEGQIETERTKYDKGDDLPARRAEPAMQGGIRPYGQRRSSHDQSIDTQPRKSISSEDDKSPRFQSRSQQRAEAKSIVKNDTEFTEKYQRITSDLRRKPRDSYFNKVARQPFGANTVEKKGIITTLQTIGTSIPSSQKAMAKNTKCPPTLAQKYKNLESILSILQDDSRKGAQQRQRKRSSHSQMNIGSGNNRKSKLLG